MSIFSAIKNAIFGHHAAHAQAQAAPAQAATAPAQPAAAAAAPQAAAPAAVQTMKRYDKYLQGSIEDVTGGNGSCDPLDDGTTRGIYTWYYLRCIVHYADGYVETVSFPWPFKFTRQDDPFARHDGRRHEFPGQPPPAGFVLPHPFAMSRAVCAFYRDECKAVIDRERANGEPPYGGE